MPHTGTCLSLPPPRRPQGSLSPARHLPLPLLGQRAGRRAGAGTPTYDHEDPAAPRTLKAGVATVPSECLARALVPNLMSCHLRGAPGTELVSEEELVRVTALEQGLVP